MIRAIIFDLGRVVLWFDNNVFLRKLAERAGSAFEDVKEAVHANIPLIREFDRGTLSPPEFHGRVCDAVGARVPYDFFFEIYNPIFRLNEPVLSLIHRLKVSGLTLVLLSNTDPERFGYIRRTFPQILVFDAYVLSYEVKLLKPDPAIYHEAVRRAGADPGDCVFVDDLEDNIRGAAAAGLTGILYAPETDLEAEFVKLGLVF